MNNKEYIEKQTTETKEVKKPSKLRCFLYRLSWAVIWPIVVVASVFIAMLVILDQILASPVRSNAELNNAINADAIFYFEMFILAIVTMLVVVLGLIKWLLRTRKQLYFRSGAKVLGVYIWIGIAVTGLTMATITKNPDAIKPPVLQDSGLMAIMRQVGGQDEMVANVSMNYVDSYPESDKLGEYQPYEDSRGDFSYGTITIKRGSGTEDEKAVVAHEYLHHIWETKIDPITQHDLTSQLMTLYGKDDWFKNRVAVYSDTNMLIPTELFAFYCTESSDQYLTQYLIDQCNTYIKRDTLTFIR